MQLFKINLDILLFWHHLFFLHKVVRERSIAVSGVLHVCVCVWGGGGDGNALKAGGETFKTH